MARITIEDCVDKIPDRFELVMLAAQRARKISAGAALTLDRDNDKNPVVSLREIAEETVEIADLKEELVKTHQRVIEMDDDEDVIDSMEGEEAWSNIAAESNASGFDDVNDDADDEDEPSLEDMAGGAPKDI